MSTIGFGIRCGFGRLAASGSLGRPAACFGASDERGGSRPDIMQARSSLTSSALRKVLACWDWGGSN
eukprot:scaffold19380_cov107-Isochrysis_galbana.AAC.1